VTLTAPPRLLLVHAHPDDESLWTGGTIARYAARGVQVAVVTCTLGEQGEVIPPDLAELVADAADQLGGYRAGELRAACAALGVTRHRYLGGIGRWRDSGMVDVPGAARERAFVRGEPAEQIAQLAAIITEFRPQVVVTYGPDGGYGHPDHIRAHEITTAAATADSDVARLFHVVQSRDAVLAGLAELADVPDLPFRLPTDGADAGEPGSLAATITGAITTELDVSAQLPAKLRALRAHATQVSVWEPAEPGAGCYALSNGIAAPVLPVEHFVLAHGSPLGAETDLFGGLGLTGAEGEAGRGQ
jgi:N-acetyl-1-D-myo-inositol-2-amino-2-deoxy-alpha-D-glucopyranoside deacetylase